MGRRGQGQEADPPGIEGGLAIPVTQGLAAERISVFGFKALLTVTAVQSGRQAGALLDTCAFGT